MLYELVLITNLGVTTALATYPDFNSCLKERVQITRDHLLMSVEWKGPKLGVAEMKRHYTNYFKGIAHFKEHKQKLVTTFDLNEILDTLKYVEENADSFELV